MAVEPAVLELGSSFAWMKRRKLSTQMSRMPVRVPSLAPRLPAI
jgi:hypothetical protein